ncbi:MAG: hypothetical protein HN742_35640 [Lentisphaerae bacterium]|jgi:hypothetical protein|nr:hypothetical protein [Lentisphaerota bacterium]MBT4815088.1 hypothetical protein [Lentisphaerota bacterium]MBT5608967.1 hypothetical protein [Lentisphaerota bacterium]MBT7057526.1 hypothetical protein [Lentisphaerota bacterium]MBT7847258.1 hypothetical protein [Lentisphaerota bacterium]
MKIAVASVLPLMAAGFVSAQTVIHVAPGGSDTNPGTAQSPLATLAGARERVRQVKQGGTSVTVELAAGTYAFSEPVVFSAEDSGTATAPIVYRAAVGTEVRLSGGRPVIGWQPVTDPQIVRRLAPEARGFVQVADLKAQGITSYGKLTVHGFAMGSKPAEAELFFNDTPMTLARYPNQGFKGIKGKEANTVVKLDTDRVARWAAETDPWIFAYWHHDWAELHEPIVAVDTTKGTITRREDIKARYGITRGRARWYAYNLLAELDTPGEFYLDRQAGRLYFWPPEQGGSTVLSQADGLIRGDELSHVTFQGFTVEVCRSTAVVLRGGTGSHIVGCTLRNTGHRAASVSGGTKHEIYGCDVYHCGEGGIGMYGGDRKTLTPAGHNAENNHVHHYSRRARTYKTGITVSGCGNRIAHNLVHHGPHMALSAGGNDHIVEYNEIHNAVYESGDAGAYYVGRDYTQRGNILRYNYWHQIVGATGHGGMTIYLDDQHCGHTIHGNLFERCSRAVFIGGGDDNTVTNNVFLDCWKAAHMDNRGMGWQKKFTDDPNSSINERLRGMPYKSELWAKRYPNLVNIENDDRNVPKRNVFRTNLSAGGLWDDIHKGTRKYQTVEDNLVFDQDKDWIALTKDELGRPTKLTYKDPAAVNAIGFEDLPLEKMGVYADPRRASWPVEHQVDKISLPEPSKPRPDAKLPPNPTYRVARTASPIAVDGHVRADEWGGPNDKAAMVLSVNFDGKLVDPPAKAWLTHDGTTLRVAVVVPLSKTRKLGSKWGGNEAVELSFRAADGPNADTLVLRGFAAGKWATAGDAGAGAVALGKLGKNVAYATQVRKKQWSAEWEIPLANLGVVPGDRVRANVTVRRMADGVWAMWRPTMGNSFLVERVGTLELVE